MLPPMRISRSLFLSTPSARRATRGHYSRTDGREHFYPRPPRGGRRTCCGSGGETMEFLSTPSARRATFASFTLFSTRFTFLSTPSARRATAQNEATRAVELVFLSTPSARRATSCPRRAFRHRPISIHALREEGDDYFTQKIHNYLTFLSTPSARRATKRTVSGADCNAYFYPRPPRGGRLQHFYIFNRLRNISIHALREEGDRQRRRQRTAHWNFYPRPPRGGRPSTKAAPTPARYFYPRPPRGGRLAHSGLRTFNAKFLSTPSARRATRDTLMPLLRLRLFLSTPSARRATNKKIINHYYFNISIHALREEGDLFRLLQFVN